MTPTTWAILIIACICMVVGTCSAIWYLAWHDGYDAGRHAEKDRQAMRKLRDTRASALIRAKTGPDGGCPPWYVTVQPRRLAVEPATVPLGPAAVPRPRATDTGEIRMITAAADLYIDQMKARGNAWRERTFS